MKPCRTFLILLMLFYPALILHSQEMRIVSGIMKDDSGEPLIGVNVFVKGSTLGTVTDINGWYSINTPIGSTLVFSFIGFTKKEVVVTYKNSAPIEQNTSSGNSQPEYATASQNVFPVVSEYENGPGTAVFSPETPSFTEGVSNNNWSNGRHIDVGKLHSIVFGPGSAHLKFVNEKYYNIPHVSYYTAVSMEKIKNLPKRQDHFSQGRPMNGGSQWMGPETGEILSWGPHIRHLEFDGSDYIYDLNGSLVAKGTGNGRPAKAYDPKNAFCNGFTYINNLQVSLKTVRKEYSFTYTNKLNKGILPGLKSNGNMADFKWKKPYGKFKFGTSISFDDKKNNYLNGSPDNTLLMASILTTPSTFDITNNQKAKNAFSDISTYLNRSYSLGKINHPYWLLHEMRDSEHNQFFSAQVFAEVKILSELTWSNEVRYQQQENNIFSGFRNQPYGLERSGATERNGLLNSWLASSGLKWQKYSRNIELSSSLRYDWYDVSSRLERFDISADLARKLQLSRIEHSVNWNSGLNIKRWLLFQMTHNLNGNNRYSDNKMLYSPTLALGVNILELLKYYGVVDHLKLKANWGYNYSFVPLNFAYGRYNFQEIPSASFSTTSFDKEILPDLSSRPEKIVKKNIGAEIRIWNYLMVDVDLYHHKITNTLFPIIENGDATMRNLATTQVKGLEVSMDFYRHITSRCNFEIRLIFDLHRSKTSDIYGGRDILPLGGFADVHTALVKGMPTGVIVGSAWERDEHGNMVIGDDGYPLVDNNLRVIANPNPKFDLGLETSFNFRKFSTSVLMEYRQGGKVWNGTGNVLSYLGLSEETLDGRKTMEYIFPGVKPDGSVNTTVVDFANPSKPLNQNRWYRYGLTGVAEDAVENASMFKISEISASYKIAPGKPLSSEIAFFVRNPLFIRKYSGNGPNITLWEKPNTMGLDLFNMPSVSSIGVSVKLNL